MLSFHWHGITFLSVVIEGEFEVWLFVCVGGGRSFGPLSALIRNVNDTKDTRGLPGNLKSSRNAKCMPTSQKKVV